MLHAKILRSEYAHARIVNVDTSEAEKMPGVIATLTGAEVPENSFGPTYQDQPILAYPIARHRGDGVAAVAATTEQFALIAGEDQGRVRPVPAVYNRGGVEGILQGSRDTTSIPQGHRRDVEAAV